MEATSSVNRPPPRGVRGYLRWATKGRSGPTAWVMYVVIRAAFAVMQVFPINWNLRTARWFARLWPRLTTRHRDRAIEHLTRALSETHSRAEIERIADRSLESLAMFAVEAICLPRLINRFNWNRYINSVNFDEALQLLLSGRGVILVAAHFGSYEVMGHLLAAIGIDMVAVMRPLDNVYLNRFLVRSRQMQGLTLVDKKGAATKSQAYLEEGRPLAFIGDQDAGRKGMFVDFFGRPASTYKSIVLLAMSTVCPIVVGYARRLGDVAKYEVGVPRVIHPHEWESQDDPLRWITQQYTTTIEEIVRRAPEQYLWIHRRWKSEPPVRKKRRKSEAEQATSQS